RIAASSSITRMRDFAMPWKVKRQKAKGSAFCLSSFLDSNRLELPLADVGREDVERQDVARPRRADDAAQVGNRRDGLTVDLEENALALDAAVERGAHRLDARDEHAREVLRIASPIQRLPIELAHVQSQE